MENRWYIIRTDKAGVFFGHIKERRGNEATLTDARCLWYWEGAASLMQLAVDGVSKPNRCKFTVVVPELEVLDIIEILPCSDKAVNSIMGVEEWKA